MRREKGSCGWEWTSGTLVIRESGARRFPFRLLLSYFSTSFSHKSFLRFFLIFSFIIRAACSIAYVHRDRNRWKKWIVASLYVWLYVLLSLHGVTSQRRDAGREREKKDFRNFPQWVFSSRCELFPSPLLKCPRKLIHASDGVTLPLTSSGALMLACCSSSMLGFSFKLLLMKCDESPLNLFFSLFTSPNPKLFLHVSLLHNELNHWKCFELVRVCFSWDF